MRNPHFGRWGWLGFTMLLIVGAILGASVTGATVWAADYDDSTYLWGFMPFAGQWGLTEHASEHHRVECEPPSSGWYYTDPQCPTSAWWGPGDWAVDLFAPDGTAVVWRTNGIGYQGGYAAQVWAIMPTCVGEPGSEGGWTVFVDVYGLDQWLNWIWEGWMAFGHLDLVQVSPGQNIVNGQVLGYTRWWDQRYVSPACYDVDYPNSVHVHYEEYNHANYACYWPWNMGDWLGTNHGIGQVGRYRFTKEYEWQRFACY